MAQVQGDICKAHWAVGEWSPPYDLNNLNDPNDLNDPTFLFYSRTLGFTSGSPQKRICNALTNSEAASR
jgi:hypothetical protein